MANKIDNVDVGTVTLIEKTTSVTTVKNATVNGGQQYDADAGVEAQQWRIEGFTVDAGQATVEAIENMKNHKQLVLIDCTDSDSQLLGYGKVTSLRLIGQDAEAGVTYWEVIVSLLSVMGNMHMQTVDCFFVDLLYRSKLKGAYPALGKFNKTWSVNRLEFTWEAYVANYKNTAQQAVFDCDCGDDLSYIEIYEYNGSAYVLVDKWGSGGVAFGSSSGGYTVDFGARGAVKGIGTIGRALGTGYRVIVKTESLSDGSGQHVYNSYATYQRLLKLRLVHVARDTVRPYPQVTWVDGSVSYGVP